MSQNWILVMAEGGGVSLGRTRRSRWLCCGVNAISVVPVASGSYAGYILIQ